MSARYHAPAVACSFDRPGWAGGALLLAGAALLMALLAWCLQPQVGWLQVLLALSAALLASWLLYEQWSRWPKGRLLWNGDHWLLEPANLLTAQSLPVHLRVGIDGGHWLWLEISGVLVLKPNSSKRKMLWIFISRQHSPEQWGDLRRAVYSSIVLLAEQG